MKQSLHFLKCLPLILCLLYNNVGQAQVCENFSLDFKANVNPVNGDFITLNTTTATPALTGDANFTVETWFSIASAPEPCGSNFRRLFAISGTGTPSSRFEVGECGGQLRFYWIAANGTSIPTGVTALTPLPRLVGCHHLAVVRDGNQVQFYLDGILLVVPANVTTLLGSLNTTIFRVGHWGGGATPGQDWWGTVDDVRLWSTVRTAQQINDLKDCTLGGSSLGLIANWTFDQMTSPFGPVITGGNNTTITQAQDMSGNNNHGTLINFTKTGSTSNFICSPCAPTFNLAITEKPNSTNLLTGICSGDPAHFCITPTSTPPLPSGSVVDWQVSDNGGIWNSLTLPSPVISGYFTNSSYCFYMPSGKLTTNCGTNAGFVDRKYRAKISKTVSGQTCTFYTNEAPLKICCPVTNATINLVPTSPTALCESAATSVNVSLSSTDLFVVPLGPNVTIDWCVNNGPVIPAYHNLTSFTYTGAATSPKLCFKAVIKNCICPALTVEKCIDVDKQPMCGLIDKCAGSPFYPTGTAYEYLICPGNEGAICMVTPANFKDCNPVWQFHLDIPGWTWQPLGSSNSSQNTNVLPQVIPFNNPTSPYLWPPGATCIYYRIECRPKSYPNSQCTPCYSNEVKICLLQPPTNTTITGAQQFCVGGSTVLSVVNPNGNYSYTWYWNGVNVGTGPFHNAILAGCYVVEITDSYNCLSVKTPPYCIEVCEIVPKISCPTGTLCAAAGQPITLSGCQSYDTCSGTGPLTYTWTYNNGTVVSVNGCQLVHYPDPILGTTYTLTVTNALNPACSAQTSLIIKPCN
jgi:hypothetical protein